MFAIVSEVEKISVKFAFKEKLCKCIDDIIGVNYGTCK